MRRAAALVAVVTLAVAGCGRSPDPIVIGGTTSTASTAAGGGASSTTTGGGSGKSGASTTAKPRGSGGAGSTTVTSPAEQRPTTATVPGDGGATGPPGAYARTVLRPTPANTVTLDFIFQSGAQLRSSTTDHLLEVMRRESAKTIGQARGTDITEDKRSWSPSDLAANADAKRGAGGSPDKPVLHILVLKGQLENEESALGVAIRGDVLAVFVDQVARASTPLVPSRVIEDAVATHELGHLLGLVDLALDRKRGDPEHPGHSKNRSSVMYWAIDADVVAQVLDGPPSNEFDSDDRADLAALRSGA